MHDLLTHTSGLMIGVEHAPWSRIDALRARDFPATMEPGERFWYSNLAYKLVGFALEDVTGMPIHDLLTERLIGPLGLTDTFAAITQEVRADAAVGYGPLLDDRPAHRNHPLAPAPWQPSNTADGSIVSTAPDLCCLRPDRVERRARHAGTNCSTPIDSRDGSARTSPPTRTPGATGTAGTCRPPVDG